MSDDLKQKVIDILASQLPETAMDELVEHGVLSTGEVLGMKSYTLTADWAEKAGRAAS